MLGRCPRREVAGQRGRRCRGAFTLVELLVVIAVIAILASLALPALSAARGKGQAAVCLNNHRQLSLALQLYADESEDRLPYNFGAAGTKAAIDSGRYNNWATSLLDWELNPANTNLAWLRAGGLGPFLSGGVAVLRCPSDRVVSALQKAAGWTGRGRSVSLNAMVGNAGEFMVGYSNTNNPSYRQYWKLGDIWAASRIFTFIDEHPDSINDGYFLNRVGYREWLDLPASYHQGAATLSFLDGHGERRRWVSSRTRPPARPDAAQLPIELPETDKADYDWLMDRTTVATGQAIVIQN
ncbi:MAG: type II secretion system protein [Verrucomicrobiales bacterium]|nr:type II secretion system protein [Verrucomicrobiales bacterium]